MKSLRTTHTALAGAHPEVRSPAARRARALAFGALANVLAGALASGCDHAGSERTGAPHAAGTSPRTSADVPATASTDPQALHAVEIALDGDGRVLPIALAAGAGPPILFATGPGGLSRTALDGAARTARLMRTTPLDYRVPGASAAYDASTDALFWAAPLATTALAGPEGASALTTSYRISSESGMTATLTVCPPSAELGTGPSCDHVIDAAVMVPEGLLLGGVVRLASGAATPWLGLVKRNATPVVESRVDEGALAGLRTEVALLRAGPNGVLAAGLTRRGSPSAAWFTVLHAPEWTAVAHAPAVMTGLAERSWVAATPAGADFWVAWPRGAGDIALTKVDDGGRVVRETSLTAGPTAGPHARRGIDLGADLAVSLHVERSLWLMVCESSFGGAPRALRLFEFERAGESARAPVEHTLELPSGFYAHATLWSDGRVFIAGRIGTERPVLLVVPLPR